MPHVNIKGKFVGVNFGGWTARPVSMPVVPGIQITSDRPETAPKRGIVSPTNPKTVIDHRINAIREVYEEWRAIA